MYTPKHFQQAENKILIETMRANSFATVISVYENEPFISHLPLLIESQADKLLIIGHMARPNPQWKHFLSGSEITVVFSGPHTYITPSWYVNPKNEVPTWNYAVVHARGIPKVIEGYDEIHQILDKTVQEFEQMETVPWSFQLSENLKRNLVQGVVGFEIQVTRLEGKFKMSQNRSEKDRQGVLNGLSQRKDEMSKRVLELMKSY